MADCGDQCALMDHQDHQKPLLPPPISTSTMNVWLDVSGNEKLDLVGSIIKADATATAFHVTCNDNVKDDVNDNAKKHACSHDFYVTYDQWAILPTPPVTTGTWDVHGTVADIEPAYTTSLHCQVTGTVPHICTSIGSGGRKKPLMGTMTTTFKKNEFTLTPVPVKITAGLDKLPSTTSLITISPTSTSTASNSSTLISSSSSSNVTTFTSTSISVTSFTSSGVTSASTSTSLTTVTTTNAAVAGQSSVGNLGLLGMFVAFLLR